MTNVVEKESFPGWVIFLHCEENVDRWVPGHIRLQSQGQPSRVLGPQALVSCGDGCHSLFLGLRRIWTWAIREHLPIFSFHQDPKVCRACMLKRKVIGSHYHEANPALVPWEIVRLWLIPQMLTLTSFRQPWSPQIVSYFWTEVIMNLICVLSWNKTKHPRCVILREIMGFEQPWVWCNLLAV